MSQTKKYILLFVLISIFCYVNVHSKSNVHQKRQDQSCTKHTNYISHPSWYFDQQCIQCYLYADQDTTEECHECSGTVCSKCGDGFIKIDKLVDNEKTSTCQLCYQANSPNILVTKKCEVDLNYVKKGTNYDNNANYANHQANIKCFASTDIYYDFYNEGQRLGGGTLTLEASVSKLGFKGEVKQRGNWCAYILFCKELNDFGGCKLCNDGFYVDKSYQCTPCKNANWNNDINHMIEDISPVVNENQKILHQKSSTNTEVTQEKNDAFPASNTCVKCYGEYQCTACADGYYLATNYSRETFDKNVARYASFCKPCNYGCYCNDAHDKCLKCKQGYYEYRDPFVVNNLPSDKSADSIKLQQCFQCPKYCAECKYDYANYTVICTKCVARTTEDLNNETNLDQKVIPVLIDKTSGHKECKSCSDLFTLAADQDNVKTITYTTVKDAVTTSDGKNQDRFGFPQYKEINTIDVTLKPKILDNVFTLDTEYSDFEDVNNSDYKVTGLDKEYRACSECEAVELGRISDNEVINVGILITCAKNSCANGFVQERLPRVVSYETTDKDLNDSDKTETVRLEYKDSNGNAKAIGSYETLGDGSINKITMENLHICQPCQRQIELNDLYYDYDSEDREKRYKRTSRCKIDDSGFSMNNFQYSYNITQCADAEYDRNFIKTQTESTSYADYGNGYFNGKDIKQRIQRTSVTNFFIGQLRYFKVSYQNNKNTYEMCADNKRAKCRNFATYKKLLDSNNQLVLKEDCRTCFKYFIKTVAGICKRCLSSQIQVQYDRIKSGDSDLKQYSDVGIGCAQCDKDTTTGKTEELKCIKCLNMKDYTFQNRQQQDVNIESQFARNDKANEQILNYAQKAQGEKCEACAHGCLNCVYESNTSESGEEQAPTKKCTKAMSWFRLNEGNPELCDVDYCINCDTQKDKCDKCQPGYTKMVFSEKPQGSEAAKQFDHCIRCDSHCAQCTYTENNTKSMKICQKCETGFFLRDNKCYEKKANCINWKTMGENSGKCEQCAVGYLLADGWCYDIYDLSTGQYDSPYGFDTEVGINKDTSNMRNKDGIRANRKLRDAKKNYWSNNSAEPTARILSILDDLEN